MNYKLSTFLLLVLVTLTSCKKELKQFEAGHWSRQWGPVDGTNDRIRSLHYFNQNEGVLITADTISSYFNTMVWRTSDGGNNWTIIDRLGGFSEFAATQDGKCYFFGDSTLKRTTDFGKTWTTTLVSNPVVFPEDLTITPSGTFFGRFEQNEIRTSQDGLTWTVVLANDPAKSDLLLLHFASDNLGFAFRDNGALLRTTDGGNNWATIQANLGNPADGQGVSTPIMFSLNEQTHWLAAFDSDENLQSLWLTHDQGENWEQVSTYTDIGANFKAIYFLDENRGFALSTLGKLWQTLDGGRTWINGVWTDYAPQNNAGFTFPCGEFGFVFTEEQIHRWKQK